RSALWKKILANVLRLKLTEPVCGEGPAYGGAILAMVAAGEYPDVRTAAEKIVRMKGETDFDEETAAKYDKGYERYKKLYAALKDWYRSQE
ncbi:MAG: xylulokinase, partial [Clostridia bacterium]